MYSKIFHFRPTLALAMITLLSGVSSEAQTPSATGPGTTASAPSTLNPAPQYLLYHLFFRHLAALQNAAQSSGAASAPSTAANRALVYKHVLALNDAEYQTLLAVARACEDSVAQDDTKARAIIRQMRSQYPGGKIPAGTPLPALPDSLIALQAHRNAIIHNAITDLQQQLPSASSGQINKFIYTHFGPRSRIQHLALPRNSKTGPAARARMNQAISSSQPGGQQ
jgi:hypothetical protein